MMYELLQQLVFKPKKKVTSRLLSTKKKKHNFLPYSDVYMRTENKFRRSYATQSISQTWMKKKYTKLPNHFSKQNSCHHTLQSLHSLQQKDLEIFLMYIFRTVAPILNLSPLSPSPLNTLSYSPHSTLFANQQLGSFYLAHTPSPLFFSLYHTPCRLMWAR